MQKAKDLLKIQGPYEFGQETRGEAEWGRPLAADSCSSFLSLTHYWYVINAIQCVTVFSPLLHLWVLCSPSHCCIHFWILKSRSRYTPKADTLTSAPLFCFYLVIFYLFLFCLFFFLLSSPALPYLWKKCQHWGLSASSPWMNEWSQANRASHLFDILVWV